jgi:hypothetical protein
MKQAYSKILAFSIFLLFIIVSCSKKEKEATFDTEIGNEYFDDIIIENTIFENEENEPVQIIQIREKIKFRQYILIDDENLSKHFIYEYDEKHLRLFLWDFLLEYSDSGKTEKFGLPVVGPNFLGTSLHYLSKIKLDIDIAEGEETWFSSWYMQDSAMVIYNDLYMHIVNESRICTYTLPIHPRTMYPESLTRGNQENVNFYISNLPGQFHPMAWIYDINDDGFDEIICIYDIPVDKDEYPKMSISIVGYNREIDGFVNYLNLEVVLTGEETDLYSVQYIQDQNNRGLMCLVDNSKNESLIIKEEDFKWGFFSWDNKTRKYIEREIIVE